MNILVADDDVISRKMLSATLARFGHEVDCAGDGAEAWGRLERCERVQLVVLDWQMPGLDGPEICRRLRARRGSHYTYVILMTSSDSPHDAAEGLDAGADDFIAKPFDVDELRARVRAGQRIIELESEMNRSRAYLAAVLANIDSGVLLSDHRGRVVYGNDALVRMSSTPLDALLGLTREQVLLLHAARFGEPRGLLERVVNGGKLPEDVEMDIEIHRPERRVYRWVAKRIALPGGHGQLDSCQDVTEEVERSREQARQARIDHLTRLYNRHAAEEMFSREAARASRTDRPLSVVLADIDLFKRVNDAFGHNVGDHVLQEVSRVIAKCCRVTDVAIRWGGEELLVLLPDTTREGAVILAERMRAAVQAIELPDLPRVTVSCGVAEVDPHAATLERTVERADARLYEAKASGRNAVR